MFFEKIQKIIDAFYSRYVEHYDMSCDDYDCLRAYYNIENELRVMFSKGMIHLIVWLDENTDELHISNQKGEELTDFADEYGWTEADVRKIRFG